LSAIETGFQKGEGVREKTERARGEVLSRTL